MKNIFRFLVIVCLLAGTGIANGQNTPGVLLLDSIYTSNWVSNSWFLNLKSYNVKNGSGQTIQTLLKKYNTGSGQFLDFGRALYNYTDTIKVPTTINDQLFYSSAWYTFQYSHYIARNIMDTNYSKDWSSQLHKFYSGVRNIYQYNDSLLPIENISQTLDTATQNWVNTSQTTYTYNSLMQPLDKILQSWQSSTSTWENVTKYSDVYDVNNLLVSHLEYEWNDSSASWVGATRTTYFNNQASLPYLVIEEFWNSATSQWDSLQQTYNIYNQNFWLMTIRTQVYQQNKAKWLDSYLTYYTFFPSGVRKTMTGNLWDTIHNTYIINAFQRTDSATGKIAEVWTKYVNQGNSQITGGVRDLYTYNASGDSLLWVDQDWNVPDGNWSNKTQLNYTYDSHNLLSEELTQTWNSSGSWDNSKKADYYYSDFIGIGEHALKGRSCLFSNPMETGSSIYCPDYKPGKQYQLRICSLSGIEVYKTSFRGGESVRISESLTPGIYFLIIEENNTIVEKDKIIIIR